MGICRGKKVRPLSTDNIRKIAEEARRLLQVTSRKVDVVSLLECSLAQRGVIYDYCDDSEMGHDDGLTIPDEGIIKIRASVYEAALSGNGRARFTFAHELGHLILHQGVSFSRSDSGIDHRIFEDSEWQADTFAAEFMMPLPAIRLYCSCAEDIAREFGVSAQAAEIRWNSLKKKGLL